MFRQQRLSSAPRKWFLAIALLLLTASASAETEIAIHDLEINDLHSVAFTIEGSTDVTIEAVGAGIRSGEYLFAYPWIIDSRTRELVWSMDEEVTDEHDGSKWLREYNDDITLRAGSYELYFYAGPPHFFSGEFNIQNFGEFLQGLDEWLGKGSKDFPKDDEFASKLPPQYSIRLTAERGMTDNGEPVVRRAPVGIVHPGNDTYQRADFSLTQDCEVEIYCIGEYSASSESMVDGGWITNARTRERVWDMNDVNIDHAGGAQKNRRFHDRIMLKSGDYTAYYFTDDSHAWDDWNAPPPVDPTAWGLRIFPSSSTAASCIVERAAPQAEMPLLRVTGVGDNELVSEVFRLKSPTSLRVYAIGEYDSHDDRMADYAWLARANDRAKLWVMSGHNTEAAGGAEKNRQFDGLLTLEAGDYAVYYVTDGSHSAGDGWNSSPPYDQRAYGISIYPSDASFSRSEFTLISKNEIASTTGLLAGLTELGDGEEEEARFTLTSPTRVRVHAIGEGFRSEMADYGWIEDARTGDVVWEMTFRKTSHAGGAEKNREVDQIILLDKGEYIVHFVTDDSHSFREWNSDPPSDPTFWGITIAEVSKARP